MPRLPTALLRKAYAVNPLLVRLLGPCRNLGDAQNELRWLREYVDSNAFAKERQAVNTRARVKSRSTVSSLEGKGCYANTLAETKSSDGKRRPIPKSKLLARLVAKRAKGTPLQYILGTEWFGELEIACRSGVLIPRQDTAASTTHLAHLFSTATSLPSLRLLDLCTGTGCISLLFRHILHTTLPTLPIRTLGVDISTAALRLALHNLARQCRNPSWISNGCTDFLRADVLRSPKADHTLNTTPSLQHMLKFTKQPQFWDIVISNPPYISPAAYWSTTRRSVRGFEPRLALVPPPSGRAGTVGDQEQGDAFYGPLLRIAQDTEAKVVLLEVADMAQAVRVARRARDSRVFEGVEIWADEPGREERSWTEGREFEVIGLGEGRSVVCWRGVGGRWMGKGVRDGSASENGKRH